jgi:hypothetical protein
MADAEAAAAANGPAPAAPPPPPLNLAPSYRGIARPEELMAGKELTRCKFCSEEHERFRMYKFHVCEPCADDILKQQIKEGTNA